MSGLKKPPTACVRETQLDDFAMVIFYKTGDKSLLFHDRINWWHHGGRNEENHPMEMVDFPRFSGWDTPNMRF